MKADVEFDESRESSHYKHGVYTFAAARYHAKQAHTTRSEACAVARLRRPRWGLDREHELTVVLADDTRYRIYRSIAEAPSAPVTVSEVAERFGLHPNVARMHLGKLEQAGFVSTGFRHSKTGGRPAKLYRLSDRVATFGYPPRRYELLSSLALAALAEGRDLEAVQSVCRDAGRTEGRRVLTEETDGRPLGRSRVVEVLHLVAERQGLLAKAEWHGDTLAIEVHNCVFRELSTMRPELVCAMHRAFLEGVLGVVTAGAGEVTFSVADESMSCGADCCSWTCDFKN
jgi:predicted ArsR family transcriptional regulator